MKPGVVVLAGVLLIVLLVSGCTEPQPNTEQTGTTKYVCPDGSTVDSPSECPEPKLVEKVLFNPTEVRFYIQAGDEDEKTVKITNNNQETILVACQETTVFGSTANFEPIVNCYTWDNMGYPASRMKIQPSENHEFYVTVHSDKDVHYTSGDESYIVTTRAGDYNTQVKFYIGYENSGTGVYYQPDSTKDIPIVISVS